MFEVHAADQFHGDEADPIRFAEVIGLNDVGVDQVRDELGFTDEVLDEIRLAGVIGADHLDGDALDEVARAALLGFVNDTHAAFKNLPDDFVPEFVLDGEKGHAAMLEKRVGKSSFALHEPLGSLDFTAFIFAFCLQGVR